MNIEDEVRAIWAEIPSPHCIGKCWDQCTVIPASPAELVVIQAKHGTTGNLGTGTTEAILFGKSHVCSFLTEDHRCSIYDERPAICRLYGVAKAQGERLGAECEYGCKPPFWLTPTRAHTLLNRLERLEG